VADRLSELRQGALVLKPRVGLTRIHRVFAPNNTLRAQVTPGRRTHNNANRAPTGSNPPTPTRNCLG
jgi:hypothetical protein